VSCADKCITFCGLVLLILSPITSHTYIFFDVGLMLACESINVYFAIYDVGLEGIR
jgi:hypothetical protein